MKIDWGKTALIGGGIALLVWLFKASDEKPVASIAPGEPTPNGTNGLSGLKKNKALKKKALTGVDKDYTAHIFKKKKEVAFEDFNTSGKAMQWAKEQVEKDHSLRAEIWQGRTNKLSEYRRLGKNLIFRRS